MENLVPLLIALAVVTGLVLLVVQEWSMGIWAIFTGVAFLVAVVTGNHMAFWVMVGCFWMFIASAFMDFIQVVFTTASSTVERLEPNRPNPHSHGTFWHDHVDLGDHVHPMDDLSKIIPVHSPIVLPTQHLSERNAS